ncbi:hypothetical protein HPULCUR_006413 [Helicostylum pulchrum]|uniref:F-box domain-containing protein n=1 Tax=Helicostylum pulchrum TaxID=562976 RepID=A0ABP9Y2F2_9FUNG
MVRLEPENRTSAHSTKSIKVQQNDIFQFQLTCKNWDSLARQKIYKHVKIKRIQQLESFIYTLKNSDVGPLVKHIYLQRQLRETVTREKLVVYIRCIANFCTFLKSLNMESGDFQGIWNLIKDERLKGNFTKLQAIPFTKDKTNKHILDYNDTIFTLQQTLHELAVYNNSESLDETKLRKFPNINTVFFKLGSYCEVATVNRYMKWLPSVTSIEVDFDNFKFYQNQVDHEFPIHISPQVKQLSIKYLLCKSMIYSYLMKAFPNLQDLRLKVLINNYDKIAIPTNETVQFLEYLLSVPELYVSYIPVKNQNDVMLGLRSRNKNIKKLKIRYIHISSPRGTSYLTIKTCPNVKERTSIEVFYIDDIPSVLPRIGLIEQSEKYLQYLDIDMGLELSAEKLIRRGLDYGVTLSNILQQSPNLRGICIRNTVLNVFGTHLQEDGIEICDYITLANSLIHSSFLPSLSSCASYIFRFRLKNCRFSDEAMRSTPDIDMSNTRFNNIVYDDYDKRLSRKAYLKLTKTINNTISWYLVQDDDVKTCTENDYENSLPDQEIISLSIRCRDVHKVRISLFKLNIVFET